MITLSEDRTEDSLRQHDGAIDAQAFAQRAQDIIGVIEDKRGEIGLDRAIDEAAEQFVDSEPNQELHRFAHVIAMARRQAKLQEWLDDDREKLHHGHLDHLENVNVGHHYEMLRREACEYNHMLRGVIELSGHAFTHDDLTGWLVSVSQGRLDWARAEITGAISEVALHGALQGLPELKDLRYGTLDEDLVGYDFMAEFQGALLTIDAKTGRYWPLNERKHGHRHLEISVPREGINGFHLDKPAQTRLRHDIRAALAGEMHVG